MAAHGTQKLFDWFGGGGLAGYAGHLESAGFRPGRLNAIDAGVTETAGGILLAAGLATPSTGAAVTSTMRSPRPPMRHRVSSR
jgi:putative oxidoreductase